MWHLCHNCRPGSDVLLHHYNRAGGEIGNWTNWCQSSIWHLFAATLSGQPHCWYPGSYANTQQRTLSIVGSPHNDILTVYRGNQGWSLFMRSCALRERVSPCGLWHCGSFLLCNATCAENIRLRFGDLCLPLKVKSADEFRVGIVAAYFNGQLFAGMVEEKSLQCRETSVLDKGGVGV